jgi:hypothetical protein
MRIKIGITFSVLKKQGGLSITSNHNILQNLIWRPSKEEIQFVTLGKTRM